MTQSICVAECYAHIEKLRQELVKASESLGRFVDNENYVSSTLEDLPDRISVLKVAELIGVKPATVRKQWRRYRLIRSGRGRHGRTFYKTESVLRYLRHRDAGGY